MEDLALLIGAAAAARTAGLGIWSTDQTHERSWRERYCADMRTRVLHSPEDYFAIEPEYRLWIWPQDLNQAISRLNLTPASQLVNPA